ncbi:MULTISPECIES: 4-hydroxyphenylpyruvate dioxygenase [Priestia]|uniref:4-hydroxyphenylpyruvate dioxygenase n=1 Tax=Priestia TaxID=2800373 RepID=UPI00203F13B1|nr:MULTISPECIES: 4-hydroxyphenylpyruvate dioxygenase [Priestia]MCM3771429.1 4-hydroxyphenylpyruvate dioxygenase [Priestia aryabhattai]MDY0943680.1 4-hydroxyphenylpyruvate dioxygenase [Priestia megaterium]
MSEKVLETKKTKKEEIFPVQSIHHLELYVGNAKQAAYYYSNAFGFKIKAYRGLETGCRDRVSYVLEQGAIRLVVTGSLEESTDIAAFVKLHGEGTKDIALKVSDIEKTYKGAVERGAIAIREPWSEEDENGIVKKAIIGTYGDTVHTLVETVNYKGSFLPGYQSYELETGTSSTGIIGIDHIVGNVEIMDEWTTYYEKVFGFNVLKHFDDENISTEYSALMSKVMMNGTGRIKFPINEPAEGKRKSQIQEYLDFYKGPGVQHLALLTNDIIKTVKALKDNGVEFLDTPATYYEELSERVGKIDEDLQKLQELSILVDRDDEGYLLQIFTKPIVDRPTLFIEIIQRKGALGFGDGNFKALFESIEREQERRGNI